MPDGWVELSLGELTENTRPICYGVLKPGPQIEGGVPLVKITDMDKRILGPDGMQQISNELDNEFRRSRLRGGEVLLSIQGTVGRVAIAASTLEGANISRTIAVIDPDDRLHNFYLMYILEKIATQGDFDSAGSTRESLNISTIRDMKVLCPPLPEQKRIVDLISSVDSYIEALQQQLDSAKRSRNAVLHELLTAGSADWVSGIVGDISDLRYGFTESANWDPIGPKFLRITDIQDGSVDWDSVPYCQISDSEKEAQLLEDGDLVFARTGATTGKSFLVTNPPVSVCASYLIRLRPNQSKVNPHYLSIFFQSEDYWSQVMAGTSGSAQGGVNASKLSKLKIDIPPLSIQIEISEIIQEMDNYTFGLQKAIRKSQDLRSGLLNELLSGEHEIPSTYDKVIGAA
jgi:type I restriction enzyme S subunit